MNILRFMEDFPSNENCKVYFRDQGKKEGIQCKKCGYEKHYWLKTKWQMLCIEFDFRTTLKSGSIMEGSKVVFHPLYKAMAFMTYSKNTISGAELQRQLEHPKYDANWRLMHKIRSAMVKRDAFYQLEDAIEFVERYFEKATSAKARLKRGRGS